MADRDPENGRGEDKPDAVPPATGPQSKPPKEPDPPRIQLVTEGLDGSAFEKRKKK